MCAYRTAREPDQIVVNKFIPSSRTFAYMESVTTNAARLSSAAAPRATHAVIELRREGRTTARRNKGAINAAETRAAHTPRTAITRA